MLTPALDPMVIDARCVVGAGVECVIGLICWTRSAIRCNLVTARIYMDDRTLHPTQFQALIQTIVGRNGVKGSC